MADARVLRDLAEEVERLDGPNRETEKRIWRALNPHAYGFSANQAEAYTGSIDAAAKLMPAGLFTTASRMLDGGWNIHARRPLPLLEQPEVPRAVAATEPLARTACALRALAADLERTDAPTV